MKRTVRKERMVIFMNIKISKDFILGAVAGTIGTLYFTAKKFADIIRAEKVDTEIIDDKETEDPIMFPGDDDFKF